MYYSISELVNCFISEKFDKLNIDADGMYKPKIEMFLSYLLNEIRLNDDYKGIEALKNLDFEHVFLSMEYFIKQRKKSPNKKNHVTKVTTLDSYYIVISDFFKYLQDKHINCKKILLMITKLSYNISLRNEEINKVAFNNGIIQKAGMEPYTDEKIKDLLQNCNVTISEVNCNNAFTGKKHTNYKQFTSAIIAKLIYCTGIKYKVIETIMYDHINTSESYIILNNNYKIDLPKDFSDQLDKYKSIRNCITSKTNNTKFFVKSSNSASPAKHTYIADYLNSRISKTDTVGLAKHTIIKLINVGVPTIVLKDLTTFEDSVLEDCLRYREKEEDYSCLNRILNNAFSAIHCAK